jgi:hypothetical protein
MNRRLIALLAASAVLPCLAAGCGNPAVVSGNVTYEGKAVDDGSIVFLPEDGGGPTCGGPIAAGQYRVPCPTPGKKIVQIIGVKKVSKLSLKELPEFGAKTDDAVIGERHVYLNGERTNIPIYGRGRLVRGTAIYGPAIVEDPTATIIVLEEQSATVDRYGNIAIRRLKS